MKTTPAKSEKAKSRPRKVAGAKRSTSGRPVGKRQPAQNGTLTRREGLAARELAVRILGDVLHDGQSLSDALAARLRVEGESGSGRAARELPVRDRALVRVIVTQALRYARPLRSFLAQFLSKPLPVRHRRVELILLASATQILESRVPAHAAISLAVELTRQRRGDARLDKLVNAVLRRVSERADEWAAYRDSAGALACLPDWMAERWKADYSAELAEGIAAVSLQQAALDISAKSAADRWAARLKGTRLATGTVRLEAGGMIADLEGYQEGSWWVQDASAALPARLFGNVSGETVIDLCAAPGGKTAQLASLGAHVVAVDASQERQARTAANLERLSLDAEIVTADILSWQPSSEAKFVLLDAPCSATGTIRRHPDILHLKRETDQASLALLQSQFLDRAFSFLAAGGTLVYCTCALEKAEGEEQIASFLDRTPTARRLRFQPSDIPGIPDTCVTSGGDIRILPTHTPSIAGDATVAPGQSTDMCFPDGMDGFFISRVTRTS